MLRYSLSRDTAKPTPRGRSRSSSAVILVVCTRLCCHTIHSGRQSILLGVCGCISRDRKVNTGVFIFYFFRYSSFLQQCSPSAVRAFVVAEGGGQRSLSLVEREIETCVPTTNTLSTAGDDSRKISDRVTSPIFEPASHPPGGFAATN